jgi:hypothetical protein
MILGAYDQYLKFCLPEMSAESASSSHEFDEALLHLQKAVFLAIRPSRSRAPPFVS